MIIESSPTNLDPRSGTDAFSERIDELLFDALVRRDEHFQLQPWVAERWEIPDPLTYIFHLRHDVKFHDGRPLTSRDVKWTIDSMISPDPNLRIPSLKASSYQFVQRIDAPDPWTVILHLKEPFATLLWNLSDGAFGIVPYGSGKDFSQAPVGSGPFFLVENNLDEDVVIERNNEYWGEHARLARVRFNVIPDATTRALELRKGSADIEINALGLDTVETLRSDKRLQVEQSPGTIYQYLALNLRDPILKDPRVRQAIAYSIDRQTIIHYLLRDLARPAASILPPQQWAYSDQAPQYAYDPSKAKQILDNAGYVPDRKGVRFHLVMKTSTDESVRLLAAILQQQLRAAGIQLDIRSFEFATFYSDVVKGSFQLFSLRWIGGNQDPDIFENVFHSASFPPKRANRGYYSNPEVDRLVDEGRSIVDQERRKQIYAQIQRITAEDLPYVHLWYIDNVLVHTRRVKITEIPYSGSYDFLRTAELSQ